MKNLNRMIENNWVRRLAAMSLAALVSTAVMRAADGDFSKQYERAAPAVVTIVGSKTTGTAFYVGGNQFLTNAHVVLSDRDVEIVTSSGEHIRGYVLHNDPAEDIAVVRAWDSLQVMFLPKLNLNMTPPKAGARAYVIGSPAIAPGVPVPGTLTAGTVSNVFEDLVQIDAAINPGNSGGPVLNSSGDVIGMAELAAKGKAGMNFAITTGRLNAAMQRFTIQEYGRRLARSK